MPELPSFAMHVTDLSQSIAFYRDRVGFTLVEIWPDADVATMLDSDRDLLLLAGPSAGDLTPLLAKQHQIIKIGEDESVGFLGGDLASREKDLRERGIDDLQLVTSRFGDATLSLKDPDKYTLNFITPAQRSPEETLALFEHIPDELDQALAGLSESDLDRPKVEGGWGIRQIVHHMTDAELLFLNGMRADLLLPGQEYTPNRFGGNAEVSETFDYAHRPVEASVSLFRAIHGYAAQLAKCVPGAWERYTVRGGDRKVSFGQQIGYSNQHAAEHLEEIYAIRKIHGK